MRGTIAKTATPAACGPSTRLDAFGASHACMRSMRDAVIQLPVSKILRIWCLPVCLDSLEDAGSSARVQACARIRARVGMQGFCNGLQNETQEIPHGRRYRLHWCRTAEEKERGHAQAHDLIGHPPEARPSQRGTGQCQVRRRARCHPPRRRLRGSAGRYRPPGHPRASLSRPRKQRCAACAIRSCRRACDRYRRRQDLRRPCSWLHRPAAATSCILCPPHPHDPRP